MIRLRPFKVNDVKYITKWIRDERSFIMWCANHQFKYPLTEQQFLDYKDIYEKDEFGWIFTALNEDGIPVGHFFMRKADYENESVHLGFVVVDEKYRGQGLGKEMIGLAVTYAFEILKVKKVTLCVFGNNHSAHNCYKSAGFEDVRYIEDAFPYQDEKWGYYEMQIVKKAT